MKQLALTVRSTALLTATCLGIYLSVSTPARAAESMATIAPGNAVVFFEIADAGKLQTALQNSDVGKTISASPMLKSTLDFLTSAGGLASQYLGEKSLADIQKMMPAQWGLYILELPEDADTLTQPAVVFAGTLGSNDNAFRTLWNESIFPRFKALASDMQMEITEHAGVKVYSMQKAGESPTLVAFAHGMMVLGSRVGIQSFIDGGAKPAAPISEKDTYKTAVQEFLPDAVAAAYVDLVAVVNHQLSLLPEDSPKRKEMWILGTENIRSVSCSAVPNGGRFHERLFLDLGDRSESGLVGLINTREPIGVKSATLIPKHFIYHGAMSITSGTDLLTNIRDMVVAAQGEAANIQFDQVMEFIRTQLQVDFEKDIAGQIGAEVFAAVATAGDQKDWMTGKRRPRVRDFNIISGLEVKDPTKFRSTLRFLLESPFMTVQGITLEVDTVEGIDIHRVNAPKLPGGGIAYALINNFLVIGPNADALKEIIKAHKSGDSLAKTARYTNAPKPMAGPVLFSTYVSMSDVLKEALPKLIAKAQPKLIPFIPAIVSVSDQLGEARVVGRAGKQGIFLDADVAVPAATVVVMAAASDHFGKPFVAREAKAAEERMKELGKALKKYHRRNQAAPDTLAQLVPAYIKELPTDPFSEGAEFGYGVAAGGTGWILTSIGPDGQTDIDLDEFTQEKWKQLQRATDPDDIEEAKMIIYRFKFKRFADERGWDDEGDIPRVGKW